MAKRPGISSVRSRVSHECHTSVTRVSHETLEADPKFETFDAFLRKRQRLGRLGTNFQDSLLAEIAYVFFPRFVNMYRPETD